MNILILNGSPKGKNSITVQTALYLQKLHPEHEFNILQVGQQIRKYEQDFTSALQAISKSELILFVYPVYTFLVPYQLQRFIELMKEHNADTKNKVASQISTSKHFYDVTAHKFIEENCYDLGLNYLSGLSADMEDLLTEKGQREAQSYFQEMMFKIEHKIFLYKEPLKTEANAPYSASLSNTCKSDKKKVVIVTSCGEKDLNLRNMIEDFKAVLPYTTREINLREFPFSGGCLGCMECAVTGKCVYKDGFDSFLRNEIQSADAMIYAFSIENHYANSCFKCYDDRQFCNGHRAVTTGMPVGYLISGHYREEANLQMVVEARSEVGGVCLCGVATDEADTAKKITDLSKSLCYAFEHVISRPINFYGVGGTKIFRDLIYLMQGMMKADHKFYKEHGIYDFPQKQKGKIIQMKFIGALMSIPAAQKKMKGKMSQIIVSPYEKIIENAILLEDHH